MLSSQSIKLPSLSETTLLLHSLWSPLHIIIVTTVSNVLVVMRTFLKHARAFVIC
jgi:hypothetical protein